MGACKIGLPQVLVELVESCSMVLKQLGEKEAKKEEQWHCGTQQELSSSSSCSDYSDRAQ